MFPMLYVSSPPLISLGTGSLQLLISFSNFFITQSHFPLATSCLFSVSMSLFCCVSSFILFFRFPHISHIICYSSVSICLCCHPAIPHLSNQSTPVQLSLHPTLSLSAFHRFFPAPSRNLEHSYGKFLSLGFLKRNLCFAKIAISCLDMIKGK